jgi:hypothetical protein
MPSICLKMPHEYSVDQMSLINNVTDTDVIDASTGFKCYVSISISVPVRRQEQHHMSWLYFNEVWSEVIVRVVDISGIVYHHFLTFFS